MLRTKTFPRQALEVVYSNIWIPEIVRVRVPDRRTIHSTIPLCYTNFSRSQRRDGDAVRPEDVDKLSKT